MVKTVDGFIEEYGRFFKSSERQSEIISLLEYSRDKLDFEVCPASHKYHGAEEGGLFKHSLLVTQLLFNIRRAIKKDDSIPDDSLIIVGMFHDIGKAGYEDDPYYIPNPNHPFNKRQAYATGWKENMGIPWEEYIMPLKPGEYPDPRYLYSGTVFLPHAMISLYTVARFMKLSQDEQQAIIGHNGLYTHEGKAAAPSLDKLSDLALLAHHADMWIALNGDKL